MKFKIPFLQNVRRGLATNSSSSHSLVYFTTPRPGHDTDTADVYTAQFGWDDFRLTTRRQKLTYVLVQILQREGQNVGWVDGDSDAHSAVASYVEKFPHLAEVVDIATSGYVDHQSHAGDLDGLMKAALDPKVEIWGGNDNEASMLERYGLPEDYDHDERVGW